MKLFKVQLVAEEQKTFTFFIFKEEKVGEIVSRADFHSSPVNLTRLRIPFWSFVKLGKTYSRGQNKGAVAQ